MLNIIIGILIGAGAILPGISSGVMCVVFGIYEKLLNSVLDFFKNPKENFKFLFPICIGVIIGVVAFGNILKYLFTTFYIPTCFAFIGLILGSLPVIYKQAKKTKISLNNILVMLLALSFSIYLIALESSNTIYEAGNISISNLIFSGFIMSAGVVIPGISNTVLLMIIGTYNIYLNAVSTLNFTILIPMGIGLAIGSLIFLVIIRFLFKYFRQSTYFAIIGFVLGSVFVLYPGFNFNIEGIISIVLFVVCFYVSKYFEKK